MDDVIATNSIIGLDARIMARIDGENCYGPAKLRMILAWMVAEGIERENAQIRFYSDHVSDAPVMEWADEPFAVNPHRSEEHTSELQSLMRLSYAVFCLKTKTQK